MDQKHVFLNTMVARHRALAVPCKNTHRVTKARPMSKHKNWIVEISTLQLLWASQRMSILQTRRKQSGLCQRWVNQASGAWEGWAPSSARGDGTAAEDARSATFCGGESSGSWAGGAPSSARGDG